VLRRLTIALLLVLAAARPAPAQGGWTTEKHPELGLTFPRARDYEQVPTQPDEPFVVLFYAEKVPEKPQKPDKDPRARKRALRPELNVVWIDELPERKPATGGAEAPPPAEPQGGSDKPASTDKDGQPKDAKPPINSLERWVEQRLPGWELGKSAEGKAKKAWAAREVPLLRKSKQGQDAPVRGWAYVWRGPGRTIAFVGFADELDYERSVPIWRESAEKADIDEPEEASAAKLERLYARSKWRAPEFRIEVRKRLVRGWKAEDTDNYIVVYDTTDQPLVRKIIADLETIRKEYERLFPPAQPVTAVSTVRVCKGREEYLSYGGVPGSAGYWNSETEELVLYDAEKAVKGGGTTDADTFIVLYHEAFHQFIHYSTGELPPHSWFNEGHGDFFSGARVRDGKVRGIGPNPWRVGTIRAAVAASQTVPWKEIVRYEQPQYYANPGLCYAQGWAMVYFLRTADVVQKKPEWARILPTYFDTLKQSWNEELARLGAAGKKDDRVERLKAGLAARTKAVDAAFAGVDMDAIDEAWRGFAVELELPKGR
jgi:hypothetical protein